MTTDYDQKCADDFMLLQARVDRYFVELTTSCPYGLPYVACFYQAMFGPLTDRAMELFLAAGYRRNGNCLYAMHCRDCEACIPIRLRPRLFAPNRNQRRAARKNSDLAVTFHPVTMDEEHLELCGRFLASRYPQERNNADGYYRGFFCNTIVNSMRIDFRQDGKLLGGSIVDLGERWMNAVYFYFDPDATKRSLGTFNILTMVDVCLEMGIEFLYLGYLINEVSAMRYKRHFRPHEIFLDEEWQQGRCFPNSLKD